MKTSKLNLLLIIIFSGFYTSCDNLYFNVPQPIDAKNSYEFPKEYRGKWIEEEDTIIIGKNYFIYKDYKQTHSIALNDLDTATYLLKHSKIYIKEKYSEIPLSEGYPYAIKNDTIHFKASEIYSFPLSKHNFLRKVNNNYIVNSTDKNNWWYLYLIQPKNDSMLYISILNEKDLELISNHQVIYKSSNTIFLNASWTVKDMDEFIKKGGFTSEILELNLNKKLPFKK